MEERVRLEGLEKIDLMFDCLLAQTIKNNLTYEEYLILESNEEFYGEFEQLGSWKQKYGYKFSIYNDHLINDKKHFHLDNKEKNVHLKLDFEGNILEMVGKNEIDRKVHKILKDFLKQPNVIEEWNKLWDKNNEK